MTQQTIYENPDNRSVLIQDAIITTIRESREPEKYSIFPLLNYLILYVQEPIVIAILKENNETKKREYFYVSAIDYWDEISSKLEGIKDDLDVVEFTKIEDFSYYLSFFKLEFQGKTNRPNIINITSNDNDQKIYRKIKELIVNIKDTICNNKADHLYIQKIINNMNNNTVNPYCSFKNTNKNSNKEDEVVKNLNSNYIQEIRALLDDTYSGLDHSPLFLKKINDKNVFFNLFCVLKLPDFNTQSDRFPYVTRIILSSIQKKQIKEIFNSKKKHCNICQEKGERCLLDREEIQDSDNFIKAIEYPLKEPARAVSHFVLQGGLLDFGYEVIGANRNWCGEEESYKNSIKGEYSRQIKRQNSELCLLRQIAGRNNTNDIPGAIYLPIFVNGVGWACLCTIIPLNKKNELWGDNYQIVGQILPRVVRKIQRKSKSLYLFWINKAFNLALVEDKHEDANQLCKGIAKVFPYPLVSFFVKNPDQNTEIDMNIRANPFFDKQINYDFISSDEIISELEKAYLLSKRHE